MLSVSDILMYNYCQRKLFLQKVLGIIEKATKEITFSGTIKHQVSSSILGLRGVIDQLEISGESVIPVELKTGKAPKQGVYEQHQLQLAAYILLLQEQYPTATYGYVYYLASNEKKKVLINPFLKQEVMQLLNSSKKLLSKQVLPSYCENKQKCLNCEIKKYCYHESYVAEKMQNIMNHSKALNNT